MENPERVQFADTLRGIASVSVLIAHYTGVFWAVGREGVAGLIHAPALPLDRFAFPTYLVWIHTTVPMFNWGAFGVALFFVVSGFAIPFSLRNATWSSFLVGRFFRIVPVYMVGFTVTLAGIWLVGRYFDVPWPFGWREVLSHYIPGLRDLLWSPAIDGIVWTLEVEMKFYVICALAIALFRRRSLFVFLVPVGVALLGFVAAHHAYDDVAEAYLMGRLVAESSPYLVFMFIGTVFHYQHIRAISGERAIFVVCGLFLLFAILLMAQAVPGQIVLAWDYGFAVMLFGFAASFQRLFRSTPLTNFFAKISYPLYVVHGVAGYVALRVLMDLGAKAWVSLIIVTAGAIGLAWLLHVFVEVPSHQLGKTLARRIRGRIQPQLIGAAAE